MTISQFPQLQQFRHIPAAQITEEVARFIAQTLSTDARVSHVEFVGRDDRGRAMLQISAVDTIEGDLDGTFSVGRIIQSMSETQQGHRDRLERDRLQLERREKEHDERRWANARALEQVGVRISDIVRISNSIGAGRYVDDDDWQKWYAYERIAVRDEGFPLRVAYHLPNVISYI